jgi:sigma-E factor negative regulatory protein RseB
VIRNRKGVRCVLQDSNSVVEDAAVASTFFPELPLTAIDNKSAGYHLKLNGKARIAGQVARRVSIKPRDVFRYGYDYWLEEQSGLLLKWVLKDTDQKVLAKLMFTDFSIGADIDLKELESDSPAENFVALPTFSKVKTVVTQSQPRWQPSRLPPGFKLSSHNQQMGADGIFEHMVYSDGLAAVSVYIEMKGSEVGVLQGVGQLGTNNAYSRQQGELQITAIGEVPAVTVKTIANSMTRSVASN